MKRFLLGIAVFLCLLPCFAFRCAAQTEDGALYDAEQEGAALYGAAFDAMDDETRGMLKSLGIDENDVGSLRGLSPESLFALLRELFGSTTAEKAALFGVCLALMVLIRLSASFLSSQSLREAAEQLGGLCLVFLLISASAAVADACVRALTLTRQFMLALVPMLAAAAAFSGAPVTAAGANALTFTFAEGVSTVFTEFALPLTAVGAALSSASALCPAPGIEKFAAMLNRFAAWGIALTAGVFSAMLGIRGALGGAADSVTAKGVRFVLSGAVPVVGSAVGDALSSLAAGMGVMRGTLGVLAVFAAVLVNLPALCSVLVWKLLLFFISLAAELFDLKKISAFAGAFTAVFNALTALIVFHVCVFIVAVAVLVKVKAA